MECLLVEVHFLVGKFLKLQMKMLESLEQSNM